MCLVGYDDGIIHRMDLTAVDPTPLEVRVLAETSETAAVRWRHTEARPSGDWFAAGFDDASWAEGPGGFGTRGTPGAVVRTEWRKDDLWLRRAFEIGTGFDLAAARSLALRVHHDEDAEIYINGIEAARLPRWSAAYTEVPVAPEAAKSLRVGRNVIAIHCHQKTGGQYIDAGLLELVRPAR